MPRIKTYKLTRNPNIGTAVPTAYLRDWFIERLEKIGREQSGDLNEDNGKGHWNGALLRVSEYGAHIANSEQAIAESQGAPTKPRVTADGMYRRMSAILAEESIMSSMPVADLVTLACDSDINSSDLPVLPTGAASAQEMAEIWHEYNEPEATPEEIKAFAQKLDHFAVGFINGPRIFNDPKSRERDARNRKSQNLRREREVKMGIRKSARRIKPSQPAGRMYVHLKGKE